MEFLWNQPLRRTLRSSPSSDKCCSIQIRKAPVMLLVTMDKAIINHGERDVLDGSGRMGVRWNQGYM